MTTIRNKEDKRQENAPRENFFFTDFEQTILTKQETQDLENKLENLEINDETRYFFKSAHQFSKKLEKKKYTILLEDIEKS